MSWDFDVDFRMDDRTPDQPAFWDQPSFSEGPGLQDILDAISDSDSKFRPEATGDLDGFAPVDNPAGSWTTFSTDDASPVDDIEITGPQTSDELEFFLSGGDNGSGGPGPGGDGGNPGGDLGGGDWPPADPDVQPPVTHDGSPEATLAAATLAAAITAADDAIDNLADNAVITLANGQTITGAQVKAVWNSISFHVTTGMDYGAGRGGANSGGVVAIGATTVNGYAAFGSNGMNFLLAHEIAHNTAVGMAANQSFWGQHLAAGGNTGNFMPGTTGFFEQNEIFANNTASLIATAAGLPIPVGQSGFPTHGY